MNLKQFNASVELIVKAVANMHPELHQHDGMRYRRCQFCGGEAGQLYRGGEWIDGPMLHDKGCAHLEAKALL